MITIKEINEARSRLTPALAETPFAYAPFVSERTGFNVYFKKENLQNTGSFKLRGAFNKIATLSESDRAKGVIASSAGNHAQGVAYSARHFGAESYIVMPEATPLLKVNGVKSLGGNVILQGANYDEAYDCALSYAKERDLTFIHPFADDMVMAGQGTLALEMLEQIGDLDAIISPIGGGGLISGVAVAARALKPDIKIIGVNARGANAMKNSFYAKKLLNSQSVRTIADGIAVKNVSLATFEYILALVNEIVEVDDEEIANAILFLIEKQKLVVEGAGAVGVAALLHNRVDLKKGAKIGVILSGGNIDVTMLSVIIEKGLVKSHRKMLLKVTLIDKPGSLQKLSEALSSVSANIVHIDYDRTAKALDYGDAYVSVALETKGEEHQNQIRAKLNADGFIYQEEA
ncbi:MAG: threonine ammonia-lyase [Helicobacteraceae bacterium]|jgi:threonine dehydratase|nr:threonine ammonia-lyase [Helicobacteraceae bacterium]